MFTYIKLTNFMSFKDTIFHFRNGKKCAKKFIAVYGENGSGKSNFVTSIDFLVTSIYSMEFMGQADKLDRILADARKAAPWMDGNEEVYEALRRLVYIDQYMLTNRMLECSEPTTIEYGFLLNGHEGVYKITFDERFRSESLYYFTGKQSGIVFEVDHDGKKINTHFAGALFRNKKTVEDFKDEIEKYWGKHTFFSILRKECREKNEDYIKSNVLSHVIDVLNMFEEIVVHYKKKDSVFQSGSYRTDYLVSDLESGKIPIKEEGKLIRSEAIIRDFLTQTYADIKDVCYDIRQRDNQLEYCLTVKKMIGGKLRSVRCFDESAGTRRIIEMIPSILGVFCGHVVVYDEIDDGIHDLLLDRILNSMEDEITGQLIITTHNTLLLESMNIKSAYVIQVDLNGNKTVRSLDEFPRIQGSNNPRRMYMKGLFGGIPIIDSIDYDEILMEIHDGNQNLHRSTK
ncbi:MAG: ATP-binding protein [Lachnospiraceae bacterium]|nr:ATP-binding protein [Lachnospiraceae bacterium]MBD5483093.1 ATP-binding protein [Lachnospiraceae bacterium]